MPPSPAAVISGGPIVLGGLAFGTVAIARSFFKEQLTDEEKKYRKKETQRRADLLLELVKLLEQKEENEAGEMPGKPDTLADDLDSTVGKESIESATDISEKIMGAAKGAKDSSEIGMSMKGDADVEGDATADDEVVLEEEYVDEYEDLGQISYETLEERINELSNIAPGAPELSKGIEWLAKLAIKETELATKKTIAQKDVRYSDGSKLEKTLRYPDELKAQAREARIPVPAKLKAHLQVAYRAAWLAREKQKKKNLYKALKMMLLAKEAWPWIFIETGVSMSAATVSTLSLHYRAVILQCLREAKGPKHSFFSATWALVIVELVASLANNLASLLRQRANSIMAESIQMQLFHAVFQKDRTWWSTLPSHERDYTMCWKIIDLPGDIQKALGAPRQILKNITALIVQAQLVRAKSSRMLYSMIVLHWVRWTLYYGHAVLSGWLNRWLRAGILLPSMDAMTWPFSIHPDYNSMFQGLARGATEAKDFLGWLQANNNLTARQSVGNAMMTPFSKAITQGNQVAEFISMGTLVRQGDVDVCEAETVMQYATQVACDMEEVYQEAQGVQDQWQPLATRYDLLCMKPSITISEGFVPDKPAAGHFVFDKVKFSYPGRKNKVLKGVSFEVKPGQVVGFTGPAGCGKSTCIRLVERFYDVSAGKILLDGRDIREYQPNWLRSQMIAVEQEPKLLPCSIRANLTVGCVETKPSLEEIEQVCRSAKIWESLSDPEKFPNGLETKIDAIGNVSGGEKQRICIARAILANPKILLLDEATAALDEVNQRAVQEALTVLMQGRTTFVIAHRLSTIKDADKIIGMRDGIVVDDGTHEELLKKTDGVWRNLWESQNQSKESIAEEPSLTNEVSLSQVAPSCTGATQFGKLRQAVTTISKQDQASEAGKKALAHVNAMIDQIEIEFRKLEKPDQPSAGVSGWSTVRDAFKLGHLSKQPQLAILRPKSPLVSGLIRSNSMSPVVRTQSVNSTSSIKSLARMMSSLDPVLENANDAKTCDGYSLSRMRSI